MVEAHTNIEQVVGALRQWLSSFPGFAVRNQGVLHQFARGSVRDNFRGLERGGTMRDASGRGVSWSSNRHPSTMSIRESHGHGRVFPLLSMTGKLQGMVIGSAHSLSKSTLRAGLFSYVPVQDALVRVHQEGGRSLPGKSQIKDNGIPITIPPRPFLFWNRLSSDQVFNRLLVDTQKTLRTAKSMFGVR